MRLGKALAYRLPGRAGGREEGGLAIGRKVSIRAVSTATLSQNIGDFQFSNGLFVLQSNHLRSKSGQLSQQALVD